MASKLAALAAALPATPQALTSIRKQALPVGRGDFDTGDCGHPERHLPDLAHVASGSTPDGYYVRYGKDGATHGPFRSQSGAIGHADKDEDVSGYANQVHHVEDGKIRQSWMYSDSHRSYAPLGKDGWQGETFTHRPRAATASRTAADTKVVKTNADVLKILQGPDFNFKGGKGGCEAVIVKGKLVIRKPYYVFGTNQLHDFQKDWTDPNGTYQRYFRDKHQIQFVLTKLDDDFGAVAVEKALMGLPAYYQLALDVKPI